MNFRTSCCKTFSLIVALLALAILAVPAFAQDNVQYSCDGSGTGPTCTVFQLDGSTNIGPANADTCVGGEFGCPAGEQDPVWPADWDALLYPSLAGAGSGFSVVSGTPPGAYVFTTPWNSFGSFSGIIPSTLVSTGTSTILKQGTKNTSDLSQWVVALQASPPKDAYLAGAIASYVGPPGTSYAGHELLYLGSTRFAPNGSATVGIWFFQQNVVVCASGKAMCLSGTTTLAQHQPGDLFLFLTFSGSGHATIQQATWIGGVGTAGHLSSGTGLISCPASGDQACAVTNEASSITLGQSSTAFQAPGTGFNVSGPGFAGFTNGVVPQLQFQETGVDLNGIFGGVAPCFSSVLFASVTSGSSPATASMKSILLGSFNTCAITATKACAAGTINANNTITYPISGTIENTGGGATSDLTLTDTFMGSSQNFDSGSLKCTCESTPAGACSVGSGTDCTTVTLNPGGKVDYAATITTSDNGGSDVVHASMGGAGGGIATADSNTAICQSLSFSTGITISKACSPGAILTTNSNTPPQVVVEVEVGGTVTNTNAGNLSLSSVTVYDCVGASFSALGGGCLTTTAINNTIATCAANGGTLNTLPTLGTISGVSGSNTAPWSDNYFPSVAPTCGPYNFNDQSLVTAQCTSEFCACANVANESAATTCPICPGPGCTVAPARR